MGAPAVIRVECRSKAGLRGKLRSVQPCEGHSSSSEMLDHHIGGGVHLGGQHQDLWLFVAAGVHGRRLIVKRVGVNIDRVLAILLGRVGRHHVRRHQLTQWAAVKHCDLARSQRTASTTSRAGNGTSNGSAKRNPNGIIAVRMVTSLF